MDHVEVKPNIDEHDFELNILDNTRVHKNEEEPQVKLSYEVPHLKIVTKLDLQDN